MQGLTREMHHSTATTIVLKCTVHSMYPAYPGKTFLFH